MAALTLINWNWGSYGSGLGRNAGVACASVATAAYPVGMVSGGTTVKANCIYGTGGNTQITGTVSCAAETIPDFNSGYCVPYLTSTLYTDALKAVISTTAPPAPSGGGSGTTGTSGTYALPDLSVADGLGIGVAIALVWAGAWGFRQIAKAVSRNEGVHEE